MTVRIAHSLLHSEYMCEPINPKRQAMCEPLASRSPATIARMSEGLWQILYAVTPPCDPWGDLAYPYTKCNPPHITAMSFQG